MASFSHITSKCFVNVPYERLKQDLDLVLRERIQPEIGLDGDILYTTASSEFENLAAILQDADLPCTLHAPFFELSPGAIDENIRRVSTEKLKKAFALIAVFKPASIVCHLNYDEKLYRLRQQEWLHHSVATWRELLGIAERHNTPIMLENTYEFDPTHHLEVLKALDSPYARFCLDVGHVMAFAKNTWQDWLPALEPWLGQLHLHDNLGDTDSHLAIGRGRFDFVELFNYLESRHLSPILTLEPHTEDDLWESLATLDKTGLLNSIGTTDDRNTESRFCPSPRSHSI